MDPIMRRRLLLSATLAALGLARIMAAEPASCAGITEPVFDVNLSVSVPGIITVQAFKEGDFVNTNQVIVGLDSRLEEIEAARRKVIMDNRKADWESTRQVYEKTRSISKDELEKREMEYRVAAAEYEIAQEQLRKRQITSPGAGVIAELMLHPGEACQPYQTLVRLVDIRQCYFISNVEAKQATRLKRGQTVVLEIEDAAKPIRKSGEVVFLCPVVDQASGLQRVKVLFDNADGKVRPGLAGKMSFE
jgi:RND family efflux transporter MFP subunit